MSAFSNFTRYALVRRGFTEECLWREALGGNEPLRVSVTDGPMDAPNWISAGSVRVGGRKVARTTLVERPDVQEATRLAGASTD